MRVLSQSSNILLCVKTVVPLDLYSVHVIFKGRLYILLVCSLSDGAAALTDLKGDRFGCVQS